MTRRRRWALGALAVLGAVVVVLVAVPAMLRERLGGIAERQLNACVKGYVAHVGAVDLRLIDLSVHVRDLRVTQDAHPEAPMLRIAHVSTSLKLAPVIRGRLVASIVVRDAVVDTTRAQVLSELERPVVLVKSCAVVKALGVMDGIDAFRVSNGTVSYIDEPGARPLTLRSLSVDLRDVRTARSGSSGHPSPLIVEAVVFDDGRLRVQGGADLFRQPQPAFKARIELDKIALEHLGPLLSRQGVRLTRGLVEAAGHVDHSADGTVIDLEYIDVAGLHVDYVYRAPSIRTAKEAVKDAVGKARTHASTYNLVLEARRVSMKDGTVGLVNEKTQPHYRVFVSDIDAQIDGVSNRRTSGTATAHITGRFMGSGETEVTAVMRPQAAGANFDLSARIEATDVRRFNDMLRAHAGIDVTAGLFSVYSEFHVKNGAVAGYVKPLIHDLKVEQAPGGQESIGERIKEKALSIANALLRNRQRKDVATVTPISGPLQNPKANTWEAMVSLVQNAFSVAILPGFVEQGRRG